MSNRKGERGAAGLLALLASNYISWFGNGVTIVAVPLYVLERTGNPLTTGLAGAVNSLPLIMAGILGGVVVDRIGLRLSSIAADTLAGACTALIPFIGHLSTLPIAVLLTLLFCRSLFNAPGNVAKLGLLPELSSTAEIRKETANTLYQLAPRLGLLLGPSVAGILISTIGTISTLFVDAATFAVSAVLIAVFVRRPTRGPIRQKDRSFFAEMRQGIAFILTRPALQFLLFTLAIANLIDEAFPTVLFAVYADRVLGNDSMMGWLVAAAGAGSVLGTLLYIPASYRLLRNRFLTFVGCFSLLAVARAAMALYPNFWWAMAISFGFGLASGPINPIIVTVMQEQVPEEIRGRVFGAVSAASYAAAPVGIVLAGWFVTLFGLRETLALYGGLYIVLILVIVRIRSLRVAMNYERDGEYR